MDEVLTTFFSPSPSPPSPSLPPLPFLLPPSFSPSLSTCSRRSHVISSPLEAHVAKNRSLLPNASCQHWVSLEIDFPAPVKSVPLQPCLTTWLQPHRRLWARAIHLSSSQIPDPQNLCEMTNVSGFKLLSVRVICYTTIDNEYKYLLKFYSWNYSAISVSQTYVLAIAPFCQVYSSSALHN